MNKDQQLKENSKMKNAQNGSSKNAKSDKGFLVEEANNAYRKIKELQDENDQLKTQVKHLDEENTKADAIIADRDAYIKRAKINEDHFVKVLQHNIAGQSEEIRDLKLQIRKLTNDLNEAKLNNSSAANLSFSEKWNALTNKGTIQTAPIMGYLDLLTPTPPQTDAQKILNILKQLDPERMVFEFSLVSKEVSRIISDNKSKSASASDLLNKLA